jgi:BirA family biotin operon repressor/biotin-[acetyl-CoA-carboxylase] ligase
MQTFTLWMGVTICELVSKFVPVPPAVKWPNDIVFDGRKAGGMLTEARVDADQIRDLVFGLGLNVNNPRNGWPGDLARSAVSLSELAGGPVDINRMTAALIGRVLLAYERFADGEHLDTFAELWNKYDVLKGREVSLTEAGRSRKGRVLGIDDVGSLLLRDEKGRTRGYRAGEVTIDKGG